MRTYEFCFKIVYVNEIMFIKKQINELHYNLKMTTVVNFITTLNTWHPGFLLFCRYCHFKWTLACEKTIAEVFIAHEDASYDWKCKNQVQ